MRTQLILLAIRFILRRIISPEALDRINYYVEEANKVVIDSNERFEFVRKKVVATLSENEKDLNINVAIELAALTRKLMSKK